MPIASASVAQVHFATLPTGAKSRSRSCGPGVAAAIANDVALLERPPASWSAYGRRPAAAAARGRGRVRAPPRRRARPHARGGEREPAAPQLRGPALLVVPEVYWDLLQRRDGDGAHDADAGDAGRARCARRESTSRSSRATASRSSSRRCSATASSTPTCIPGNIFVATRRRGATSRSTSGSWERSPTPTRTTSRRISWRSSTATTAGSRRRTSRRAGCPPDTRVDEFEGAIRAVCEPVFDKPLKEISFGKLLLRLFEVSRRFRGDAAAAGAAAKDAAAGRGARPPARSELDLWRTAKPYLERWMNEQVGWRGLVRQLRARRRSGRAPSRSCRGSCTGAVRGPHRGAARRARAPRGRATRAATESSPVSARRGARAGAPRLFPPKNRTYDAAPCYRP